MNSPFRNLAFTVALSLLGSSCVPQNNQGPLPAELAAQQPVVKSAYHLAFRGFEAGAPRTDILVLRRAETTRNTQRDINLDQDYSLSLVEGFQSSQELGPFELSLTKWGAKGLTGAQGLAADAYFDARFFTRERPAPGKVYACTGDPNDPVCSFELQLPTSMLVSSNDLGERTTRSIFDVPARELRCSFSLAAFSDSFTMKEVTDTALKRTYRRSERIPAPVTSPDQAKKFSFAFRCWHIPSNTVAVYGYFLQNATEPVDPEGKEIRIR